MIYNALGWFMVLSAVIIFVCILIYISDCYEPYQFISWVVVCEGLLALTIFGACFIELGGGI